jgi:hypothetical protein
MTWLTWRQHRIEAAIVGAVLAVFAIVLVVSGRQMAGAYQQLGVAGCLAHLYQNPNCSNILDAFQNQFRWLASAMLWLNLLPALLAILVGAPLVARELEHGTHHLVWAQGVTRVRWIAVKLGLILVGALVAAEILTLMLTWWRGPFDQLNGNFAPAGFDFEGTVPVAAMAFAVALAVAAGALLRRAIPAMAATLAGFLAVRLPIEFWARPHYRPPVTVTWDALDLPPRLNSGIWAIDRGWVNGQGHIIGVDQAFNTCLPNGGAVRVGGPNPAQNPFLQCIHAHGWLSYITYQPADRFWLFQGIETAIYVALAAALVGLTIWWVRHRLS